MMKKKKIEIEGDFEIIRKRQGYNGIKIDGKELTKILTDEGFDEGVVRISVEEVEGDD